jgi:hypothetical protein
MDDFAEAGSWCATGCKDGTVRSLNAMVGVPGLEFLRSSMPVGRGYGPGRLSKTSSIERGSRHQCEPNIISAGSCESDKPAYLGRE